jgi:hypothetical protein
LPARTAFRFGVVVVRFRVLALTVEFSDLRVLTVVAVAAFTVAFEAAALAAGLFLAMRAAGRAFL